MRYFACPNCGNNLIKNLKQEIASRKLGKGGKLYCNICKHDTLFDSYVSNTVLKTINTVTNTFPVSNSSGAIAYPNAKLIDVSWYKN